MVDAQHPPEGDRAAASRKAVEARRARASVKRDLTTRVVTPQEVLRRAAADPTSAAGTLRVPDFLTALPAIGQSKRDRILEQLGISPVKRLGGLGVRQRASLREWLDARMPEPEPRPQRSRLLVMAGPTAVGNVEGPTCLVFGVSRPCRSPVRRSLARAGDVAAVCGYLG